MPAAIRAPSESERNRTILFALFLCLIVFLSEEAAKEDSERKRLRTSWNNEPHISVPRDVAFDVFKRTLLDNGTITENVVLTNVFLGEWSPEVPSTTLTDNFDIKVFAFHGSDDVKHDATSKEEPITDVVMETTDKPTSSETSTEEAPSPDRSLRWNIERSIPTTLHGANRIGGTLWTSKGAVIIEGIQLVRLGRLTLFTRHPEDKRDKILGLVTSVPPTLEVSTASTNVFVANATVVLRGSFGGSSGIAFGEPVVFGESHTPTYPAQHGWLNKASEEPYELFPGCEHPIRFDLDVHHSSPEKLASNTVQASSFSGRGVCKNVNVSFTVPVASSMMLNVEQAIRSSSYLSLYAIVESLRVGHTMTFLGPLRTGVLADLGPLSMGAFGLIALTDMYLCELLMNMSGIGGDGWWTTAALLKGCQFLFSQIPLLVLIFFGRSRLNAEPSEVVVRNLSSCMSRAQVAWLLSMFFFEFLLGFFFCIVV
jgi:hypothetical protein